jgi:hypothetical protein
MQYFLAGAIRTSSLTDDEDVITINDWFGCSTVRKNASQIPLLKREKLTLRSRSNTWWTMRGMKYYYPSNFVLTRDAEYTCA